MTNLEELASHSTLGIKGPVGGLESTDRDLALSLLDNRLAVNLNQLVDHLGSGSTRTSHNSCSSTNSINRSAAILHLIDGVFVNVAGENNLCILGSQVVKQPASSNSALVKVARVNTDTTRTRNTKTLSSQNSVHDSLRDVVSVNQKSRVCTQSLHLLVERFLLVLRITESKSEGVSTGSSCRNTVAKTCFKVGCCSKPSDVGGPRSEHSRHLISTTRTHLNNRSALSRKNHTRGSRHNRAVMIQDGEQNRLQKDTLSKSTLNSHDGSVREVHRTLRKTSDSTTKLVVLQKLNSLFSDERVITQVVNLLVSEVKVPDSLNCSINSTNNTIATTLR